MRASEATGKLSIKFAAESPGAEGSLALWGAVSSEGLQAGCGGRRARAPRRAQGPGGRRGFELGGKEGAGTESNNWYAVRDLFLFLLLASLSPNLFLTVLSSST